MWHWNSKSPSKTSPWNRSAFDFVFYEEIGTRILSWIFWTQTIGQLDLATSHKRAQECRPTSEDCLGSNAIAQITAGWHSSSEGSDTICSIDGVKSTHSNSQKCLTHTINQPVRLFGCFEQSNCYLIFCPRLVSVAELPVRYMAHSPPRQIRDHSNGIWLVSVGNLLIHQIDFVFFFFLILRLMMSWQLQM